MTERPALVFAALLLLGCGDPDGATTRPPVAPVSPACQADATRVANAFTRPEGTVLFRGISPAPTSTRGNQLDTRLPRIVVAEDRIAIDDVDIVGAAPPSALAAELALRATLAGAQDHGGGDGHGGGWANAALLYAPGATPVARLRDAIAEIDPALRLDMVVQHTPEGESEEPNPPPWLADELERLRREADLDVRRQRFRELFTRAIGECEEARAHTAFVFGRDPAVPASAAPTGTLDDALRACECRGVEVDALVAMGILTGPPNRHPLRALSFTRVDAPGDRVITAIPSDTVDAFVDRLARGIDPLRVYFPPAETPPEAEE